MANETLTRRPIKARDTRWAAAIARWLANVGCRPNQISVASVFFGGLAGAALVMTDQVATGWSAIFFVAAAVCIQLRLLCNLFDGMVAVEGGFRTKSGEIYNELPDRFADAFILAGAGYSLHSDGVLVGLGWAAAAGAVITAYVRALGASAGAAQYFLGPMAKQQRMAVMTIACIGAAIGGYLHWSIHFIQIALGLILAGCVVTIFRRSQRIISELEAK